MSDNYLEKWEISDKVYYKLNNGKFGFYFIEFVDDVKTINISIHFLRKNITKYENCKTDEEAIELITKDDIEECVKKYKEYLENVKA